MDPCAFEFAPYKYHNKTNRVSVWRLKLREFSLSTCPPPPPPLTTPLTRFLSESGSWPKVLFRLHFRRLSNRNRRENRRIFEFFKNESHCRDIRNTIAVDSAFRSRIRLRSGDFNFIFKNKMTNGRTGRRIETFSEVGAHRRPETSNKKMLALPLFRNKQR